MSSATANLGTDVLARKNFDDYEAPWSIPSCVALGRVLGPVFVGVAYDLSQQLTGQPHYGPHLSLATLALAAATLAANAAE